MLTTIKIGHASISEDGTAHGNAGDTTGYEVCTRDNYDIISNLSPNVVLRPKTSALANASVLACIAGCENNNIGYSQSGRNTLYNLAKNNGYDLAAVGPCNTDCSAFMTVCAIAGGAKIEHGTNAPTTSNMRTRFKQSGDYTVLTDTKHLTMTDYLKRGDILVKEGKHTVMVLENGSQYADEVLEEPVSPGGITTTIKITLCSVELALTNIEATKASINVKAVERKTDSSTTSNMSASKVSKYTWTYLLENLTKKASAAPKPLNIKSGQYKLDLNNLTVGTTYALQVYAAKNGKPAFCSQKVLFTTPPKVTSEKSEKREFTADNLNAVDKIYIKTNNEFKQAIIYKN